MHESRALARTLTSAFLASASISCGVQSDHSARVRVDTLSNGRVVVFNPGPAKEGTINAWQLEEDLRIGVSTAAQDDPYAFGELMSLALTHEGDIVVADRLWSEIRVFGPDGDFLRRFGREGDGPGEFAFLAGVVWDTASGVIWAVDVRHRRFMAFSIEGRFLDQHEYGTDTRNASIPWGGYADLTGNVYDNDPGNFEHLVRRTTSHTGRMAIVDSLALPTVEARTYRTERSFGVQVSVVPLSPRVRWTVAPDGWVWLGRSDEYRIHKVSFSGDTVRTVELDRPAARLRGWERDSIAAAAGLPPRLLPSVKPVMGSFRAAPDGWIWVAAPTDDGVQEWELFDEFGYHRGRAVSPVSLEALPRPVLGAGTITGVVKDDLGIAQIVRLKLGNPTDAQTYRAQSSDSRSRGPISRSAGASGFGVNLLIQPPL